MNQAWVPTVVAFLGVLAIVVIVFMAIFPTGGGVGQRLTRLWRPETAASEAKFHQRQQKRMEQALSGLGKLLPSSSKDLGHTTRMMVRAGFRSPEAVMVMRGVQLLLPVGLIALVYFTGVYHFNPFFLFAMALVAGFLLPQIWVTWRVRVRQRRIVLGLPDALDLLVVCVEAGLGLDQALYRVTQELRLVHPELSEELQLVNLEMRVGKSRVDALRELALRTGVDDIKSLVAMLIQTDRFGTDLARALRVHSDNLRTKRRQRAEEMAAKATVKMVPPLVFCIFPALFVVLLGPAMIILIFQVFPALAK